MRVMKKIFGVLYAVLSVVQGCSKAEVRQIAGETDIAEGTVSVTLRYYSPAGKSLGDYDFVLNEEVLVNDIQVMVFDEQTGDLQRSAILTSVGAKCEFNIPAGSKVVYALVNGPDVSKVRTLDAFLDLTDDLSRREYRQKGFVMIGSAVCDVVAGEIARPVITVGRMVSRVVLRSVLCNIARQYEGMVVDCVFLGNAALGHSLGGESYAWANVGGYMDQMKSKPIGLNGVEGICPDYLYRPMDCRLQVGERYEQPVCLYCYPNATDEYTCLYILATIGQNKYYYRVPLDKGLDSNVTCAVDVSITNLGAPLPPDGILQKGEIEAVVSIEEWSMGYLYNAEF